MKTTSKAVEPRANSSAKRTRLLQAIRTLESGSDQDSRRRVALAEAEFRIAVLPDTNWRESLERLQKAILYDPFHPKYFFHLGRLYHRNGDYRGAVIEYWQALKLAPASHRTCVHLALALAELEEMEKAIGRDLLESLARGSEQETLNVIAEINALLKEQHSEKKKEATTRRRKSPIQEETKSTVPCRWGGVWRLALIDQLCRPKPIARQIDKYLAAGAQGFGNSCNGIEYSVICLLLLLNHDSGRTIRQKLEQGGGVSQLHPVGAQLIEEVLNLAECESPGQFVERSARSLQNGAIPVEMVCWLFYALYAGDKPLPIEESLDVLERYPGEIQDDLCFRELRVAVLDIHARRAWADSQIDLARLIWREILWIDPHRISAAHNLALASAQTQSISDYVSDWERAVELRYLYAAAATDTQVMLEDRRTMHLAFAQQSRQRYCATTPGKKEPSDEDLAAWLADLDAIDVWLREWDFYYVNSRLRFRSAVHLLGIPRDASPESIRFAREALLEQLRCIGKDRSWIGIKTFCQVAEVEIAAAFERASTHIGRLRDPWYDEEKTEADLLLEETIGRANLLLALVTNLAKQKQARNIPIGCTIGRHFLAMPWKTLQPVFEDRGKVERGFDLVKYFENVFVALAASVIEKKDKKSLDPLEFRKMLSSLDECIRLLPYQAELRLVRCQALSSANQNAEAYSTAVEALPLISKIKDPKEAETLAHNLSAVMDNAAFGELPETVRKPRTEQQAKETVRAGLPLLEKFSRSGGFRSFLAQLMIQLGAAHIEKARQILEKGLEVAVTDEQTNEFRKLLEQAGAQSKTAAVIERIKSLLEGASRKANEAIEDVNTNARPETARKAAEIIAEAIRDAEKAEALAEGPELEQARDQARKFVRHYREALEKLKAVKEV